MQRIYQQPWVNPGTMGVKSVVQVDMAMQRQLQQWNLVVNIVYKVDILKTI
jgi:hypothetical protein